MPKSVNPDRMVQNIDIFDFKLTPGEVDAIDPDLVTPATIDLTIDPA